MVVFRRLGNSPWVLAWLVCLIISLYSLWICDRMVDLHEGTGRVAETERHAVTGGARIERIPPVPKSAQLETIRNETPSALKLMEDRPLVTKIQRVVFYLWCSQNRDFLFANYLSLLSAVKFLQPQSIQFLYTKPPRVDRHYYNTWLEEFKATTPYFQMIEVTHPFNCSRADEWLRVISGYMREGGIFLGTNTILTKPSLHLWNERLPGDPSEPQRGIIVANEDNASRIDIECTDLENVETPLTSLCMHISSEINPKDFWHVRTEAGKLFNFLMYGTESTPVAKPNPQIVIPNIAHMFWANGRKINFVFYLSALSLLYIVKVDTLYIHGTKEPKREGYWEKLMEEPRVQYINTWKLTNVFGQEISNLYHISDVSRVLTLERYGGIYSDVDAIWTQPVSDELRRYDAVAAFDFGHNYLYYPNYINDGVMMGRKGAPFWKHWISSFKVIKDDVFGFTGLLEPYKVYERYPDTVKIQRNLQVICFKEKCFPAWTDDWKSVNWKEETYAFHWTYPDPPEFKNEETLMANNSMFADMGKYVLKMAGKIP